MKARTDPPCDGRRGGEARLEDQAARENAASQLDRSWFIEAGAGTGKTRLLVERYLRLVREGRASVGEIAAVTFTEKAAGELEERVRIRLEEARAELPALSVERRRVERALEELGGAAISTIHRLCGQILRERPIESGLDPGFVPIDENALRFRRDEVWESWLPGALKADPLPARRALEAGVSLSKIRELADLLVEHRDRAGPEMIEPGPAPGRDGLLARWQELEGRFRALEASCREPRNETLRHLLALARRGEEARAALESGNLARFDALARGLQVSDRKGRKEDWKPDTAGKEAKAILTEWKELRARYLPPLDQEILSGLARWLLGYVAALARSLRDESLLSFQDLLIECRALLRDHREARGHFQRRFRYLLLDEFQDTDPLQTEIVFFLAEREPLADDWRKVVLEPGKLFFVGDPKQSIYRFRRADIELYEEVRERIAAEGSVGRIRENHRSGEGLIAWANEVFADLIRRPADGRYQPEYVPLLPAEPEGGERPAAMAAGRAGAPAVLDLEPAEPLEGAGREKVRAAEAAAVARLLLHHRAIEPRFDWGKAAILFPAASGIEHYEEALRLAGIPYHLEGGKEFFHRSEVTGVLNCLDAIEDPGDRIALVAALQSPILGHSGDEIAEHLAGGGRLGYLEDPHEARRGAPLSTSLDLLRELHFDRNRAPRSAIVSRLLEAHGALSALALRRRGGLAAVQNLKKLVALARRFEVDAAAGASFGRFSRWLRAHSKNDEVKEAESSAFEEADGVVRLMTIHKAKGLEFDLVILVNLASEKRGEDPFIWRGERLEMRLGDQESGLSTLGFESARERESRCQEAEEIRQLYVAATRARQRLIIGRYGSIGPKRQADSGDAADGKQTGALAGNGNGNQDGSGKGPGYLKYLLHHPGEARAEIPRESPPAAPEPPGAEIAAEIERLDREIEARPALLRERYRPPVDLRPSDAPGPPPAAPGRSSSPSPGAAGSAASDGARALGEAVHRLLELIAPEKGVGPGAGSAAAAGPDPRSLERLARLVAEETGIPERFQEVLDHAARAGATPGGALALRAPRHRREIPVLVDLPPGPGGEERRIAGKIDVVLEEEGGLTIVDWKTERAESPSEVPSRGRAHEGQIRLYARALARATGRTVKRGVVVFTSLGLEHSIPLEERP